MDDLDSLLDLEGAAFGDEDEGVFEDDDVGVGPSIKAGKEGGSERENSENTRPMPTRKTMETHFFPFSKTPSF